jgi:phage-related minor tail protein
VADLSLVFDLLARDRASSEVDKVGDAMKGAGDQADGFGERVSGMFGSIAALAGGAGLAVGASFMSALEAEGATRMTTAQLGLDPAESAAVGKMAGDLFAGNYGDSLEGVNEAIGSVASSISGLGPIGSEAMQGATRDALNFASAFDVDVAEATQTVGQLITSGLVPDARAGFDLLTASFQRVPAAMREELPDILNEYGTNFRALGFNGEQAFALLTKASQGGAVVLDKTGDALKEFTIRGSDMSTTSVAAFQAVGLNAEEMSRAIAAGGPGAQAALQQTAQGILGIEDPAARANTAIALFGTPLEDLSVDQIPSFLQAVAGVGPGMTDAAGSADALDKTLSTGIGPRLETFKRGLQTAATQGMSALIGGFTQGNTSAGGWQGTVQNLAASLSGTFGPALTAVAGFISNPVMPSLSGLFGFLAQHQTTVTVIAGLIGGVLAAAFGVWAVAAVTGAAANVAAWFTTVAAATTGSAATSLSSLQVVASWVLMGVQSMLQAARMAAAWFIALGPVGWVIGIVVGLVALIVANWDTVVSWTQQAWQKASELVSGAWDAIKGFISAALGVIVAWFQNWTLPGLIITHWDTIKRTFSTAIDAVVTFVSGLPGRAASALGSLGSSIAGVASAAWTAFSGAVSTGTTSVITFVGGIPGKIVSGLGSLATLLVSAGSDLIRGLINGVKNMAGNIASAAMDVVKSAVNGVKSFLGIASPSKLMRGLGANMGEGMALGIADMRPAVAAELAALADVQAVPLLADLATTAAGLGYRAPGYDTAAAAAGAGGVATINNTTINAAPTIPTEDQLAAVYRRSALLAPRRR